MKLNNYSEKILFSKYVANKAGVNAAIVHAKIAFFVKENIKANRNLVNGQHWTYTTYQELHQTLPFLSVKQIRLAVQKLKDEKLIITDNHNTWKTDKTTWYTIDNEILKMIYL